MERDNSLRLYRVILPVNDINKAVAFYTKILGEEGIRVSPGRHYFNLGGTVLTCYDPVADGDTRGDGWKFHENQYLYIATSQLEKIYDTINRMEEVLMDSAIETMPWGETLFYARDPFGNPICFVDEKTVFVGE